MTRRTRFANVLVSIWIAGIQAWSPPYVTPERFSIDDVDASNKHLRDFGFAVYRDVVSPAQVETALALLWDFFEGLGAGIRRGDHESIMQSRLKDMFGNGIVAACGAGHSAVQWYLRGMPGVRSVFEGIWGSKHLLTSFDGLVVYRSSDTALTQRGSWYHWDINPLRVQKVAPEAVNSGVAAPMVQGFLSLVPGSNASGSLVIVPGSHKIFEALVARYMPLLLGYAEMNGFVDHFVNHMSMDRDVFQELEAGAVSVRMEPGDLVVWDTRAVHCNSSPNRAARARSPTTPLARAGVLLTMAPVGGASDEVLALRREALCRGVTLTHWPTEFVPTAQPTGGHRAQDPPVPCLFPGPPAFLDDAHLKLAGLNESGRKEWLRARQSGAPPCPDVVQRYPSQIPPMEAVYSSTVVMPPHG